MYLLFMGAVFASLLRMRGHPKAAISNMGMMALLLFVYYFVVVASATTLTVVVNLLLMAIYGAVLAAADSDRVLIAASPPVQSKGMPRSLRPWVALLVIVTPASTSVEGLIVERDSQTE